MTERPAHLAHLEHLGDATKFSTQIHALIPKCDLLENFSPAEVRLLAHFMDVYQAINTFNGFKPAQQNGVRIDWILTRSDVTVASVETLTYAPDSQFPSDHFPVMAKLRLGSAK